MLVAHIVSMGQPWPGDFKLDSAALPLLKPCLGSAPRAVPLKTKLPLASSASLVTRDLLLIICIHYTFFPEFFYMHNILFSG